MSDNNIAVAYFTSRATAESAISALKTAGFDPNQIGVATSVLGSPDGASTSKAYAAGHDAGNAWEKVKSFFGKCDPGPGRFVRSVSLA